MLFVRFLKTFHVQLKHQNGNIFVEIPKIFRPCLSKPSYRAPKWALMARLMQKGRLKSPQKSPIPENQALWVILGLLAKTSTKTAIIISGHHFWSFWPAISEPGLARRKESPIGVWLKSTRPRGVRFYSSWIPREANKSSCKSFLRRFPRPGLCGHAPIPCNHSNEDSEAHSQGRAAWHRRRDIHFPMWHMSAARAASALSSHTHWQTPAPTACTYGRLPAQQVGGGATTPAALMRTAEPTA